MKESTRKFGRSTLIAAALALPLGLLPMTAQAATGAQIFQARCAMCHGKDGTGSTFIGKEEKIVNFKSAAFQKSVTDAKIKNTILNGIDRTKDGVKQRMFAFKGKLSAADVDALVKYVRSLGK